MVTIKANNTLLPSPVAIDTSDEIIWSANTGRSASGKMLGTVIAQKQSFNVKWGVLTKGELETIKTNVKAGFYPFEISMDGDRASLSSYRSTLTYSVLGTYGGVTYYNNATVTIIEQ
jgi:hypothetical protein